MRYRIVKGTGVTASSSDAAAVESNTRQFPVPQATVLPMLLMRQCRTFARACGTHRAGYLPVRLSVPVHVHRRTVCQIHPTIFSICSPSHDVRAVDGSWGLLVASDWALREKVSGEFYHGMAFMLLSIAFQWVVKVLVGMARRGRNGGLQRWEG